MTLMGRASVTGVGSSLPEHVVENQYFADYLDASDEWIRSRTGIARRHVGGTTAEHATIAGARAIADAGVSPDDIDMMVLATSTPDQLAPQTSASVQNELGLRCPAFDINVACAGFVYGVSVAASLAGAHRRILVVGSEQLTRITDPKDRSTAILMADGAGAVVLERSDSDDDAVWADLGLDGSLRGALYADHGGFIVMKGREVFKHAVRLCTESVHRLLAEADVPIDSIGLFVPHQANQRIIEAIVAKLGLDPDRCVSILEDTGNTSAASIPLALDAAARAGRVSSGDTMVFAGYGAGMAWGSLLVRWH